MAKKDFNQANISIVIFGIVLAIGLVTAHVIMNNRYENAPTHSHSTDTEGQMTQSHGTLFEVNASQAPTVSISVVEDAVSGWNIKVETDNFRFTPDNVNQENIIGEGHAHLYVDGVKVARLYAGDYHYIENFDGTRTFRVTLNANDHSEYAVDGDVIDSEVQVTHSH